MFTREEVLTLLEKWMAKEDTEAQGEKNAFLRGYAMGAADTFKSVIRLVRQME
jgi:hypothetical protein